MPLACDVNPRGFSEAHEVYAVMLKESPVFDGKHGVHQNFGHFVIVDHLTFGALVSLEERGNHFRLELVGIQLAARAAGYAFNAAFANANLRRLRAVVRAWTGGDLNGVSGNVVAAHRRFAALLGIPGMPQFGGDFLNISFLADCKRMRRCIDLCGIREHRALEASFDYPVVFDVEVREKANEQHSQGSETSQGKAQHRIAEAAAATGTVLSMRNSKLNGHVWLAKLPLQVRRSHADACEMRWRENSFPELAPELQKEPFCILNDSR